MAHTHDGVRKTRRRYDAPGHARLLTFSCRGRKPLLAKAATKDIFVEALDWSRRRCGVDLWAWVIMPEHAHVLILPSHDCPEVSTFLRFLKGRVANRVLRDWRDAGGVDLAPITDSAGKPRFWERGGGHDRNLWTPRHIGEAIDYIHMNPVRRGLCESPFGWTWSSATELETPGAGPISLDRTSMPPRP